jgi:SdrD B-like domain
VSDFYSVTLASGQTSSGNHFANAALGDKSLLANIVYVINGTTAVSDLVGRTKEGDTVQVSFTIVAGTTPGRYSLVSYTAPGKTFDPATAAQQKVFQLDTGVFGPGSHTLDVRIPHSYYQVDFVIGSAIEPFGPAGSNIFYSAQNRLMGYDNNGTKAMAANAGSLAGFVYHDANNNGLFDAGERPIPGAAIALSGKDSKNKSVSQTVVTDPAGKYVFTNLPAGTYAITETQPGGYTDGAETLGTAGGKKESDKFSNIKLSAGASGTNYNFGEKQTVGSAVAANQTGSAAFWNGTSGQNLIKAVNGGQSAKNLGNWLASNFGNLFGSAAGSANSLAGKTNAQVAAYFATLYSNTAKKAEAETLALALSVYVTTSSLAGNTAASYGFAISATGLGAATVNVGVNGAAFGLDNNFLVTVSELLLRINLRSRKGLIWDLDSNGSLNPAESTLRDQAWSLFSSTNNT